MHFTLLCCLSLWSTVLADLMPDGTGQFYRRALVQNGDGEFPSYQQSDISGRVWSPYSARTGLSGDPMVQVSLSHRAGKVTTPTFSGPRDTRSSEIEERTAVDEDLPLSDPDFVPDEDSADEDEAGGLEDFRFGQTASHQSPPLFDQIQRKLNVDASGMITTLDQAEDLEDIVNKEFPTDLEDDNEDAPKERVRRSWSVAPPPPAKQRVPLENRVSSPTTGPRPLGAWDLHWNAQLNKYRNVYNWNQWPRAARGGGDEGKLAGRESSLIKGHSSSSRGMVKRDPQPEPSPEYTETGLSLSITSPLEVLRDKVRINEEHRQKNRQRQRNRNTHRNSQRLKELG